MSRHPLTIRALAVVAAALVLGSCDRQPLAPVPVAPVSPTGQRADFFGFGLLRCSPLPYDSSAQVIGPDGGTLSVGPHTFTVPAGALSAPTLITAVVDSTTVNQIRFTPQGLQFLTPASLTMSYANCGVLWGLVPKRIAYTTDNLFILDLIPSIDNALTRTVTGQVSHFSQYAIAW